MEFESTEDHAYALPVSEITLNGVPVLRLRDPMDRIRPGGDLMGQMEAEMVPCILDSGTTCICLPDSTRSGSLQSSPWRNLKSLLHVDAPLVISFGHRLSGKAHVDVSIPASVWRSGAASVDGCIASSCPNVCSMPNSFLWDIALPLGCANS